MLKFKLLINRLLFFTIWPFGVFSLSLFNLRNNTSRIIFWIFNLYLGLIFIPLEGGDSYNIIQDFYDLANNEINFFDYLKLNLLTNDDYADFFSPTLDYLISRFTNNSKIYFGIIGFIFGYFYSDSLWYLISKIKGSFNYITIILLISFALVFSSWYGINNCRFPIASLIFYRGIASYFMDGSKKGIYVAHLSFIIHFSLIFPIIIFWLYKLLGNKTRIYFILFIFSFFLKKIDLDIIQSFSSFIPSIYQKKVDIYTNQEYAIKIGMDPGNWYIYILPFLILFPLGIMLTSLFINRNKVFLNNDNLYSVFNFSLFFLSLANVTSSIPSFSRMLFIGYLFALTVLIIISNKISLNKFYNTIFNFSMLSLLIWIVVYIRIGTEYFGYLLFIGNPVFALFIENETTILEFIKFIF